MPTTIEILKNELANGVFFDHHSPLPLYHQVYSFLRGLIEAGKLQPGDLLPSEADLTDLFNVGRQTVRKALSNLVNDHMLERYAGKGTFVCDPEAAQQFLYGSQLLAAIDRHGTATSFQSIKKAAGYH